MALYGLNNLDEKQKNNLYYVHRWLDQCFDKVFETAYIVFPWWDVPVEIRQVCCFNGGDEDWIIISKKFADKPYPYWIDRLGVCGTDMYELFDDYTITVASHS